MWAVLTFWLLLGLPGLAFVQRFDRASLDRGPLAVVARAYFASFALLTPISALSYVFELPVQVMSSAVILAILGGAVSLARDRRWLGLFGWPSVAAIVGCLWLGFDLWIGARVGSHVQGDAGFHLARVRLIGAYGFFNNWDPLVRGHQFEPIYHTNLYHSLLAACTQLTRLDPSAAWIWAWPLLKLLAAAGTYELSVAVLGSRACGYIAAITSGAWLATTSTLAFPNTLAPYALMPFALVCAVDALSRPSYRAALWLGIAATVLAQTHLLYALFLMLAVVPVLAVRFFDAVVRTHRRRFALLAAICAFGLTGPWFYAPARPKIQKLLAAAEQSLSWVGTAHAQDQPPRATERANGRFLHVEPNLARVDPAPFLKLDNPDLQAGLALVIAIAVTRRREAWALFGITAMICLWLFTPQLCMPLIHLLANWVVLRFTQLFFVIYAALVFATPVRVLELAGKYVIDAVSGETRGASVVRGGFELAAMSFVLLFAYRYASYSPPWTKEATWQAALDGSAHANAERIAHRAAFFTANIARGSTVMAPLLRDYDIPMHCPSHALAFRKGRGDHGQLDNDERRAAVEQFYQRDTTPAERLELLRKFDVDYVYTGPRRAVAIANGLGRAAAHVVYDGEDAIVRLRPEGAAAAR